ncbi:MAG: hypothetical protein ABEJ28_02745 [Salinigranum sp.]
MTAIRHPTDPDADRIVTVLRIAKLALATVVSALTALKLLGLL